MSTEEPADGVPSPGLNGWDYLLVLSILAVIINWAVIGKSINRPLDNIASDITVVGNFMIGTRAFFGGILRQPDSPWLFYVLLLALLPFAAFPLVRIAFQWPDF